MQTLNGRRVHQAEIRVNWAYQSNTSNKEDTSNHFHIFVGDLSNEVNDEVLLQAFSAFGSVSEARVMWDMKTGRSRGYGFVAFRERQDAEKALSSMDGEWLGSRAIRCNWANQKGQPSISQQQAMVSTGLTPTTPFGHHHFPTHGVQSYDMIVTQTPQWQATCYVGNLTPYTTQNDLVPLFQNFGYVVETRFQSDRGFAFVKMDTHENAAMAICQLSGYNVNGRPLKCSVSSTTANTSTQTNSITVGQRQSPSPTRLRPIRPASLLPAIRTPIRLSRRPIRILPTVRRNATTAGPCIRRTDCSALSSCLWWPRTTVSIRCSGSACIWCSAICGWLWTCAVGDPAAVAAAAGTAELCGAGVWWISVNLLSV